MSNFPLPRRPFRHLNYVSKFPNATLGHKSIRSRLFVQNSQSNYSKTLKGGSSSTTSSDVYSPTAMKQIVRDTTLLLCLVFRLACSSYTTDPRWRVISGFDAAKDYSIYIVSVSNYTCNMSRKHDYDYRYTLYF